LGGGGEPKSDDPEISQKPAKGIYSIDSDAPVRKSHENVEVQQLYKEVFDHPLSETSEKLLHTTFAPRGTPRDIFGWFLDAVDHGDCKSAASDDALWNTNTPMFGVVEGRDEIISLVNSKLPPIETSVGIDPLRYRLARAIERTEVIMPNGERFLSCRSG
jgi:NADH-quinone oxidoreductase subunit G